MVSLYLLLIINLTLGDHIECGRTFICFSNLQVHQRTHTKEKPYKCMLCPKSFSTACNMKDHLNRHLKEKQYFCQICPESFYRNYQLTEHSLKVHGVQLEKKQRGFKRLPKSMKLQKSTTIPITKKLTSCKSKLRRTASLSLEPCCPEGKGQDNMGQLQKVLGDIQSLKTKASYP